MNQEMSCFQSIMAALKAKNDIDALLVPVIEMHEAALAAEQQENLGSE